MIHMQKGTLTLHISVIFLIGNSGSRTIINNLNTVDELCIRKMVFNKGVIPSMIMASFIRIISPYVIGTFIITIDWSYNIIMVEKSIIIASNYICKHVVFILTSKRIINCHITSG